MSADKQHRAPSKAQAADPSIFQRWDRDKLMQVRDLVQRAIELVERAGNAPVAQGKLREALHRIDEELAK